MTKPVDCRDGKSLARLRVRVESVEGWLGFRCYDGLFIWHKKSPWTRLN
jgi:hypothetical protein